MSFRQFDGDKDAPELSLESAGSRPAGPTGTPPALTLTPSTQSVAANAAMQAISASMDTALRGEIKRLRDEVADLRREAARAKTLQQEVDTLRAVTLLQSEEKVPIRLRELEIENQRLKRVNRSLEEKMASIEGDMRYRDLIQSWSAAAEAQGAAAAAAAAGGASGQLDGSHMSSFPNNDTFHLHSHLALPTFTNASLVSPPTITSPHQSAVAGGGAPGGGRVVIIKPSNFGTCISCSTRTSASEKAVDAERLRLVKLNKELQAKLDVANEEIRAVQAWVAPLVQSIQQYPHAAERQQLQGLHNFASPTRTTAEVQSAGSRLLGSSMSLQAPPNVSPIHHGHVPSQHSGGSYLDTPVSRHRHR